MYNYPFKDNNEHVLNEATNINIKCLDKQMLVNILLTNKNVLIFYDTERDSALKTSTAQIYPQYEVMLSIDLNNMDYKIVDNDSIINIDNKNVILYNFNLTDFIEKDD